jgi:hypothetical protein
MESRNLHLELVQEPFANEQMYQQEHVRLMKKKYGAFWYFKVECIENEDHDIARSMRRNLKYIHHFREYLKKKYSTDWLFKSVDTKDDCYYLSELRYQTQIECDEEDKEYYNYLEEHRK